VASGEVAAGSDLFSIGSRPSRYEYKYIVDPSLVPSIRRFISGFAKPDPYAAQVSDNCYPVASLYLDTVDFKFYQQVRAGEKVRFKLRVRSYSDDSQSPVFLELKRKNNSVLSKQRVSVSRERAAMILNRSNEISGTTGDGKDLHFFINHVQLTGARPVIRIRYRREAYESRLQEPVRLTIDTNVQYSSTHNPVFTYSSGMWKSTPIDGAIIEIKFTEMFPGWIADLIRTFSLIQQPVPKYGLSTGALLNGMPSLKLDAMQNGLKGV